MSHTFKQFPAKKILIVSATEFEIKLFLNSCDTFYKHSPNRFTGIVSNISVDVLITGVGMLATSYLLTRHLENNSYHIVINVGMGGCFDKKIPLGTVLHVSNDLVAELGLETSVGFVPIEDEPTLSVLKIQSSWHEILPYDLNALNKLDKGKGITVNTITGTNQRALQLCITYNNPTIESMEGAAFMCVCNIFNIPHFQIRAVSNYVAERDKSKWCVEKSIYNLKETIIHIIDGLSEKTSDWN